MFRSPRAARSGPKARAFFEARTEHLSIHDRVRVECLAKMPDGSHCNRVSLIAVQGLLKPPAKLGSEKAGRVVSR